MKKILSALLLIPVYFYRACISPLKPQTCRFVPTCSEYAIEAIRKHGPFKGLWLAIKRIGRCHPWGGSGIRSSTLKSYNMIYYDLHTHNIQPITRHKFSICNLPCGKSSFTNPGEYPDTYFSAGIHPWYITSTKTESLIRQLIEIAPLPQILAIGERT